MTLRVSPGLSSRIALRESDMTVIFDLDYTLLDTAAFKDAMADAVMAFGPSRERFDATYRETVARDAHVYDYDPDFHLGLLQDDFIDADGMDKARSAMDGVLRKTGEFLFPDAVELLESLHAHGVRLVLLTLGNESWQRRKVVAAELDRKFDIVRLVGKDKQGELKGFTDGGKVVVVNDNGKEIDAMIQEFPDLTYVVKKGPKELPKSQGIRICATLQEVGVAIRDALEIPR